MCQNRYCLPGVLLVGKMKAGHRFVKQSTKSTLSISIDTSSIQTNKELYALPGVS